MLWSLALIGRSLKFTIVGIGWHTEKVWGKSQHLKHDRYFESQPCKLSRRQLLNLFWGGILFYRVVLLHRNQKQTRELPSSGELFETRILPLSHNINAICNQRC